MVELVGDVLERWHTTVPLHRLDVPAPHVLPFAIGSFETLGPMSRADFPHRHTFYEIVHVTGGRGRHVVDLRGWPLAPPQLCVIAPGQVHFWNEVRDLTGWVLVFDDAFLLAHPGDRELLHALGGRLTPRLTGRSAVDIAEVVTRIRREYAERRPEMVSVLQAYLHVLLVLASRLPAPAEAVDAAGPVPGPLPGAGLATPADAGRGDADLAHRFTSSLGRPGAAAERSVGAWAAELGVSTGRLHEAVKAATGRTPGQLIRHAQVLEAKRLLSSTELTVARVGREVGFEDAAYFCRFFRREVGVSPGEFRRASAT
ncbi:AraC family transcriptional regulator [Streptomyces sp. AJS327]|uniref:helix-turn-helix transcriptional regulator n=1 Tax=Streptomyces sp. AJS327 TaxID=2545265 RepID=UPI0015DFD51E|nr:AraC family transcriptional regulator [Streptomyces sp. AJS327]MBA0053214.1 AraC family transcriptional regulator [Streptomyces sp. AJS327]